jgi:hypothetical protein
MTSRGLKPEVDWEDKYLRLKDEHEELKNIFREMDEHNRELKSNIRKLQQSGKKDGSAPVAMLNKEDEQLVTKLYAENSKLKSQNTAIKEKYKALAELLEKKKREIKMLQQKVKSSLGASGVPPVAGKGTSVLQEIDIKPGRSSLKGPVSISNTGMTGISSDVGSAPDASENANYLQVARNLKVKYVTPSSLLSCIPLGRCCCCRASHYVQPIHRAWCGPNPVPFVPLLSPLFQIGGRQGAARATAAGAGACTQQQQRCC